VFSAGRAELDSRRHFLPAAVADIFIRHFKHLEVW